MGGLKLEFHWLTVLLFLLRCFRSESTLTSLDLLCVEREEKECVCVCVYCREDKVLLCDDVGIGVGWGWGCYDWSLVRSKCNQGFVELSRILG